MSSNFDIIENLSTNRVAHWMTQLLLSFLFAQKNNH